MEIFQKYLTASSNYTGMNGFLKPSSVYSILQEAAFEDVTRLGAGKTETTDKGILWMVVHMRVEIIRLPEYCENFSVVTWPGGGKHGMYTRYYELRDVHENPIVNAVGSWVLADAEKRSLITNFTFDLPQYSFGNELDTPKRLRLPALAESTAFTAKYSQADINGHLNNAKYLDIVEDIIPIDYIMTHTLRSADVDYLSEILPGEQVNILWSYKDGTWWFLGETDKPCFKAKLAYR